MSEYGSACFNNTSMSLNIPGHGKLALTQAAFHVGDCFWAWENWHPKN